jgi:hypothetical protein
MCSSNTTCFVTGSMVPYGITPQSGIDHDLVSVIKILLKAFFFCSLFPYPPSPPQSALHAPHRIALLPTPSCNKRHHTYSYVTRSKVNAKTSRTSSHVTI